MSALSFTIYAQEPILATQLEGESQQRGLGSLYPRRPYSGRADRTLSTGTSGPKLSARHLS